ncbi:MAG: aminotransferase class V-fold PLP-dependent enzyme [Gemmatimonadetes bacterium]|nr:aminotransferase class V-fold PLP-dependent enzyme [Gemmatimonadota bacterium]
MTDTIDLSIRDQFPILAKKNYLVSHSLGAMPVGAREGLVRYADEWETKGVVAWEEGWWELPVTIGDKVGAIIGAPRGSVGMQPNVSLATGVFLSSLPFDGKRNKIVTTEMNFPTNLYLFEGWESLGARVVRVPANDDVIVDTEKLLAAIDGETQVVAISHVLFRSSYIQDVAAVVAKAHEAGALVLIDVYQSAGTVPFDVIDLGVDAAVGGCLKWLCGGPGNAFLYVRPDRARELKPRLTGWQSHEKPFAFDAGSFKRAEGAWRFLTGTPTIATMRAAEAGLDIVHAVGMDSIRAKSLRLTRLILDRCEREGWPVKSPRDDAVRGGTVTIALREAEQLKDELIRRDILVDYRPKAGVRIAPHFYNTDDEVTAALDAIASIVSDAR